MKRELKADDVMYLGAVKITIECLDISQKRWDEQEFSSENLGIGFEDENGNRPWIPNTMENLLSYTPYTIEDGVMNGYNYQRPWQPKQGEPVWVWDNGDQYLTFGIFNGMQNGRYVAAQNLKISTNQLTDRDLWDFCKSYAGNEINYDNVFK